MPRTPTSPTPRRRPLLPRPLTGLGLALIAGAGGTALVGCAEGDDTTRAIRDSAHRSSLLTPASESVTEQELADATYREILSDPGLKAETTPDRRAAAAVVLAAAERGQTAGDIRRLVRLETQSIQQMVLIRAELNAWSSLQAQAAGIESYDNRQILADLDRLEDDVREQLQVAEDRRAAFEQTLDGHRTRLDRLNARAREERGAAGEIYLRLANVEPEERIRLSMVAEEHVRTGASYERDADEVMLMIEQITPRIAEVTVRLDEFNAQLERLDEAREQSNQRLRQKREQALQARADAELAAERLSEMVTDLIALRDGEVRETRESAVSGLTNAQRSAGRAPRGLALSPSTHQALGHLLAANARGLSAEADLFGMLAGTAPPVPNAAQYRDRAESLAQQAEQALTAAGEAFQEAAGAYASVRVRGEEGDAIERHTRELENLGALYLGEPLIEDGDDAGDADQDGFDEG